MSDILIAVVAFVVGVGFGVLGPDMLRALKADDRLKAAESLREP